MANLDPRTAMMEAEMKKIGRKARKQRKAVTIDDFDLERYRSAPRDMTHLGYSGTNGLEHCRRLRPTMQARILGVDPYRP